MGLNVLRGFRGHALASFDGLFLAADARFCEILERDVATLTDLTILDVTHPGDRDNNREKLDRLLDTGEPFEIEKRYVRENGGSIFVRNQVSRLHDGIGGPRIIASVELLDGRAGHPDEGGLLLLAERLQQDRSWRQNRPGRISELGDGWGMMLAIYVLEQRGLPTLLPMICERAAIDESEGYLIILELAARKLIDFDHAGIDLVNSSVVLTAAGRTRMNDYLARISGNAASRRP